MINTHRIYFIQRHPNFVRCTLSQYSIETARVGQLASNFPHTVCSDTVGVRSQPTAIARASSHCWFTVLKHKRKRLVESLMPIFIRSILRASPHEIGRAHTFASHPWHAGILLTDSCADSTLPKMRFSPCSGFDFH